MSGVSANTTTTNTNTMKNNSALTATANNSSNNSAATSNTNRQKVAQPNRDCHYSGYPKPAYSNACLIALGMLNLPLQNHRNAYNNHLEVHHFIIFLISIEK